MVLVFDLDDTLYPEITFVKSGFKAVAEFLEANYSLHKQEGFNYMLQVLEEKGRGQVFNEVLKKYNLYSSRLVKKCLSIYRLHKPDIELTTEAINCLQRFSHFPVYVVTDGNKIVQANKIKALQVQSMVKHAYITYRHGLKRGKPSPYCFELIAGKEKTSPDEIIYVADNPIKDFVGIKPLGFKTVRLLQGNYKDLKLDDAHEADVNIKSLNELTETFLVQHFNNLSAN